jgi:undecaprenyl-diphosphatase
LIIIVIILFEEKKHPGISKRDKQFIFIFLTTFLTTFIITNFFLKNFFLRNRPNIVTSFNCPKDFSFPSSHAATGFAVAYVLTFFDKKRKWFYYFIAFLISYSRIYLGCHYFFDVLVGGIIGLIISKVLVNIGKKKFF